MKTHFFEWAIAPMILTGITFFIGTAFLIHRKVRDVGLNRKIVQLRKERLLLGLDEPANQRERKMLNDYYANRCGDYDDES